MNGVSIGTEFLATLGPPGNVVFDLDGVIFLGGETLEGASEALSAINARGSRIVFATNNATKTRQQIADRILDATGYRAGLNDIVTSATATAHLLTASADPILVVGESGLRMTLEESGRSLTVDPSAANTVVVGLDRAIDYDRLDRAGAAVRNGARFVATNTDATFPTPSGAAPGAGTIVAAVATAGGREAETVGKPSAAMIAHIRQALGPGGTWMVGDRPETDLALARRAGWYSVLVLSGVTPDPDGVPADLTPDLVVASVADLADIFGQ